MASQMKSSLRGPSSRMTATMSSWSANPMQLSRVELVAVLKDVIEPFLAIV